MNRRELLISLLAAASSIGGPVLAAPTDGWELLTEAFETSAKYALFEWNDELTRNAVITAMGPFCDAHRFYMKCDDDNNTPAIIDRGEFVMEFYKDGKRRIYTITPTRISFEQAEFLNG